jgi:hypothetical protein
MAPPLSDYPLTELGAQPGKPVALIPEFQWSGFSPWLGVIEGGEPESV